MLVKEKSRAIAVAREAAHPAFRLDDGAAIFVPEAVQANVIRSVNPQQSRYVFFQIVDGDAFRRFVGKLLNPAEQSDDPDGGFSNQPADVRTLGSEASAHAYDASGKRTVKTFTWNLAFTWTGLQALNIDANTLASFPEDFRDGMAARATRLGDTGDSAPENWEGWLGNRAVHGILQVNVQPQAQQPDTDTGAGNAAIVEILLKAFGEGGMRILQTEQGEKIPAPWNPEQRIEHFGFRDGVSQPFADADLGTPRPPPPGGGTARPGGTWDPIALGELLLGYPDEDGLVQARPAHPKLRQNGTYMVFRKLEQDVVGFRRYLREQGGEVGPGSLLAAQMVGRWPDGTSLVDATVWPTERRDERALNDFRYQTEDPRGLRCPLAAHTRRANPRDSNDRDEARRHRVWRRALSYGGDFLPYDSPGDGKSRGLQFIALCARIDQQFEFLQAKWLNTGEFIGQAGIGRCPITGANAGTVEDSFAVAGRPAPHSHLPRFVKVRGGDYFFVPSLPALQDIAGGETFPTDPDPVAVNPSLDQTPKAVDSEALVKLGTAKLLAPGSPPWLTLPNGVVLVGRQKYVRRVLDDDRRFSLGDLDRRIRQICGGERLIIGLPSGDPDRDLRLRLWRDAAMRYVGPPPAAIAQATMQTLLARHRPAGALDVVRNVSLIVPSALSRAYFGVNGPDWVSPAFVASQFNKQEIVQVPRDWLATLPYVSPQDVPFTTLQAWAQTAFAHVFVNVVNAAELTGFAQRTTAEFFRHLDALIAKVGALPNPRATLLGCLMSLDPASYSLSPDRFATIVRLLLAELIVGSSGTLAEALPNFVDYLVQHPEIVDPSQSYTDGELDAIIREALRFEPVAPILFRRCTTDSVLGGKTIPANSMIGVLLKTAMFDPRTFPDPDSFSTDPAKRDPANYLIFGAGLHYCKGADIGAVVLREMVRPLLALKDLRAAAGPAASARDALARRTKFVVRFNPAAD